MKLYLGPDRVPLEVENEDVVASGGEAIIYAHGADVLKVYHVPSRTRSDKLQYLFSQPRLALPTIVAPDQPIFSGPRAATIVGFQMRRLPTGAEPLAKLFRRDYCDQNRISGPMKVKVFISLLQGLVDIHRTGRIVGDLNDQNEMFILSQLLTYWIDVDSMQCGPYPCMAATEDYLSPELYGIDLSRAPVFKPEHDYYSAAVLMFRGLLMAHPFSGGFSSQYRSLFDRAQHGLTFLDASVMYPKKANPAEVLTDDLADLLLSYLKRQRRDPFPVSALQQYLEVLTECASCHLWYPATRQSCPGCSAKTILTAALAAKVAGCRCDIVFETPGRIVHFQFVGDRLCCVADEDGNAVLYQRELGRPQTRLELFTAIPGARYALFGQTLVVCTNPQADEPELLVVDVSGPAPRGLTKTTTRKFGGGPAIFVTSASRLYRIVGAKVMAGELFGSQLAEREVVEAMPNQTWFTSASAPGSDREALFGCYRILDTYRWFLATGNADGRTYMHYDVALEPLLSGESMVDLSVRAGAKTLAVLRQTKLRGAAYVRLEQVSLEDGKVLRSERLKVTDNPDYDTVHGKGYTGDQILHATDSGIVPQAFGQPVSSPLPGTGSYVTGSDQLHRYRTGVVAVTGDRVLFLQPDR